MNPPAGSRCAAPRRGRELVVARGQRNGPAHPRRTMMATGSAVTTPGAQDHVRIACTSAPIRPVTRGTFIMANLDPLAPIENPQLAERVHQAITSAIVSGQLSPGEVLRDRVLAEKLGVSRTPVKEALVRLETTGLVVTSGRSWHVSPFEVEDLMELVELRHLLEPVGLERLERDGDDAVIEELSHFFDDYTAPIPRSRFEEYFAADHAFHKLIVSCSKNRRIEYFYNVVEQQIDRGRHFLSTGTSGRVDATLAEHVAICDAIADRDFGRAREALHFHLDQGAALMMEFVQQRSKTDEET